MPQYRDACRTLPLPERQLLLLRLPIDIAATCCLGMLRCDHRGQVANALLFEQLLGGKGHTGLRRQAHHLDRHD
ncbi:hypothetical protein D3C80_2025230 [compost metagenome]